MGLDVYAGPLSRYYSHTWLTVLQREFGDRMEIRRPEGWTAPSVDQALARVSAWWTALGQRLGAPSGWDEDPDGPYETDKPGWEGYHGLRFLALHEEFPDVRPVARMPPSPDPAELAREPLERRFGEVYAGAKPGGLRALLGRGPRPEPRYPHLEAPELWLPVDLPQPFRAVDPLGTSMVIGSVPRLRAELEALNDRTLRANDDRLAAIRREGPPENEDATWAGRFGLSIYLPIARWADERRQPIKQDY